MLKKSVSVLLVLSLILGIYATAPFTAGAAKAEIVKTGATEGTTGDCTWELDDEGVLTISGSGAMADYNEDYTPWIYDDVSEVIISDQVTYIGKYAFINIWYWGGSVTIPASVTEIGEYSVGYYVDDLFSFVARVENFTIYGESGSAAERYARDNGFRFVALSEKPFHYSLLEDGSAEITKYVGDESIIEIPSVIDGHTVTSIGEKAFNEDFIIREVIVPDTVTHIGAYAFNYCRSLKEVRLPAGITRIENGSFCGCRTLESINIPNGVTYIGDSAFFSCKLKSLSLPNSVAEIGNSAFYGCDFTSFTIPNGVTTIGQSTFSHCEYMENITIPDGVTTIGEKAFFNCEGIKNISVPFSVSEIGQYALGYHEEYVFNGEYDPFNGDELYEPVEQNNDDFSICGYIGTAAMDYAYENNFPYIIINTDFRIASVSVKDEVGNIITHGFSVEWYEKGSDRSIGTGKAIMGIDEDKEYQCEVILGEELSYSYRQPAKQDVIIEGNNNAVDIRLEMLETVTVTGRVIDREKVSLSDATVTFRQVFNQKYHKETVCSVNKNGEFSAVISNVPTEADFSQNGYYSRTVTITFSKSQGIKELGEMILINLPKNKITFQLTKIDAALQGHDRGIAQITSANNVVFSLVNQTQNKPITGFTVQYPNIILENNAVNPGDTVEIEATDIDCQMTAPKQSVKLDEQKTASCSITFIENGRFTIPQITGNKNNTLMLFDSSGKLIFSTNVSSQYTSDPLLAGAYTAVLIKKTDLLRSVSEFSKLSDFELTENDDFFVKRFSINNGVITAIDKIVVPALDESKLYYTVPESTAFSVNTQSVNVGRYAIMKCAYKIDEKYSSTSETVTIELPEKVDIVKSSLTLDGKYVPYSVDGNHIIVKTNKSKGVLRFYVFSSAKGQNNLHATLSFNYSGNNIEQPIGTATFTTVSEVFNLPEKTASSEVLASGITMPESKITVFDNNIEVGTTESNKVGNWRLSFQLVEPGEQSYHAIRTIIENEQFSTLIIGEPRILIYDNRLSTVSSITMINNSNYIVFDSMKPDAASNNSYSFNPNNPRFTFKVDFLNVSEDSISNVFVVTENNSGDFIRVPLSYDAYSDSWIGTRNYLTDELPVSVHVEYMDYYSAAASMAFEHLSGISLINERVEDGVTRFDMISGGLNYHVTSYPIDQTPSHLPGNDNDYEEIKDDNVINGLTVLFNEKSDTTIVTYNNRYVIMERVFEDEGIASVSANADLLVESGREITREALGLNGVQATEISRRVGKMLDDLEAGRCNANGDLINPRIVQAMRTNYRNRAIYHRTSAVFAGINAVDTINSAGHLPENYNAAREAARSRNYLHTIEPVYESGDAINGLLGIFAPFFDSRNQAEANFRELLRLYAQLKMDFLCDPGLDDDFPKGTTTITAKAQTSPTIDPSGYVYEAVPSNRIEGVKVEAYYYDYAVDEFGIPEEQKSNILWDAENYDQVNPLYTDENGMYAWDVPMGQWLVKFSKDGYYDTDSKLLSMTDDDGYLPVPPPQTEVNVGMVSKAVPAVERISVYEEEIRIEFSQYMQIDSVNNNTVTVKMNGKSVTGSITPVNAEYDYEQEHQYASIFTFVPDSVISGRINVTVNDAVNYASTKMTKAFTESNQVAVKPESLVMKDEISIAYNSGALLEINVLPKEAGAGLSLDVSSSSPSIVGIANSNIVTDENGHANIMLLGNLPGEGEITVSLNGTDITKTVKASVAGVVSVSDRCEKVTANIASGKTVESSTMIELSTTTYGAEIYYTLDGTCPCTVESPSRIKYTEPICITEDTFIIAYAVKDGMQESYTAGFNYFVPAPAVDMLLGDVDGDGTVTIIDATYIQRKLASIPIPFEINETIADTDDDGSITILDATFIQRWLASLPANDIIGKPIG